MKTRHIIIGCLIAFIGLSSFREYRPFAEVHYNAGGRIVIPDGYHYSEWEDYVTPTTAYKNLVDYSSAHFAAMPIVTVTAEQSTSSVTNIPFASIDTRSVSGVTVNLLSSNQQVLNVLGTTVTGLVASTNLSTLRLHVHAVGYTQDQY